MVSHSGAGAVEVKQNVSSTMKAVVLPWVTGSVTSPPSVLYSVAALSCIVNER